MPTVAELLAQGVQHHQSGNLSQAEYFYRQVLTLEPQQADALHLLGMIAHVSGQRPLARDLIQRAIALSPAAPAFRSNLGLVLEADGQVEEALAQYREAVRLQPNYPEALINLGVLLTRLGRFAEALVPLQQAWTLRPDLAEAHFRLGVALAALRRPAEAVPCFEQALRLRPNHAWTHHGLAQALQQLGRIPEAARHWQQAVQFQPDLIEAHFNLGNLRLQQGRRDEAEACYRKALEQHPDLAGVHNNLGYLLLEQGRLDEARSHLEQAVRLQPHLAGAHTNLGRVLSKLQVIDAGLEHLEQAVRLQPDSVDAWFHLARVLPAQRRLDESIAGYRRVLELDPEHVSAASNLLFMLNYDPRLSPDELFREHCAWASRYVRGVVPLPPPSNDPAPERRLRVGYVSPDFCQHVVSYFAEPVLASHDARQVDVYAYADVPVADAMTDRFRAAATGWRMIHGLSDAAVAEQVRADRIDILVDLAGHTRHHRLGVFPYRAAPIQVTYLGYPNTTGLRCIDYRLTDAVADPPGEPIRHTEQLFRLPQGFCTYAPPAAAPPVSRLPAFRPSPFTFGSLHNLVKINDRVIDLWCQVLRAIPTARLLILRDHLQGKVRDDLLQRFAACGVPAHRLDLRHTWDERGGYLGVYADIDLSLDVLPWNGHVTTCESLWMGVPMLTLLGDRHSGRMSASVQTQLGLIDFIAATPEEFVARAAEWARDRKRLARIRAGLRDRMRSAAVGDGTVFTRTMEQAYREMWRRWCAGQQGQGTPAETRTLRGS